jgi:voltage-gated sodium channel
LAGGISSFEERRKVNIAMEAMEFQIDVLESVVRNAIREECSQCFKTVQQDLQHSVTELQSLLKGSSLNREENKRIDWTSKRNLRGFAFGDQACDEEALMRNEARPLLHPPRPFNHFSRKDKSSEMSPQISIASSMSIPASPKCIAVAKGPSWSRQTTGSTDEEIQPVAEEPEQPQSEGLLPGALPATEQKEDVNMTPEDEGMNIQSERQSSKGSSIFQASTKLMAPLLNRKVLKYMFGIRFESEEDEFDMNEVHQDGGCCARLVAHQRFDYFICVCILLNSALIGVQTDHEAREGVELKSIRRIETCFAVIFTVELLLRVYVYNTRFFTMPGRGWNIFDMLVVSLQLAEEIGAAVAADSNDTNLTSNFTTLRVVRILRLIRILRLVRVIRLIGELRMLVLSIISSMRSLCWTILLLVLLIYTTGLYLTQSVTEYRLKYPEKDTENIRILTDKFGELLPAMSTLFQSITGGLDWGEVAYTPLVEEISPWLGAFYTVYMAFSILAMMNVVTGVFVESVLKCAKSEKDLFMVNNARELFLSLDDGINTQMTWELFQSKLDAPQMQEFFKAIDVDKSEARGLFSLLDLDHSDTVSIEEFINGCLRLRGPAKSLDMALVIQEVRDAMGTLRKLEEISSLIQAKTLQRNRTEPLECRSPGTPSEPFSGAASKSRPPPRGYALPHLLPAGASPELCVPLHAGEET